MTVAVQLPEMFSQVFGMGSVQAVYSVKKRSRWGALLAALVFLLGAAALFLYGAYYTFVRYQRFGPAVIWKDFWPFLLLSGFAFLFGAWAAWSTYSNWKKGAVVYDGGFAYSDRKGLHSWRWEEIDSLTAAVTRHYTNGVYTGTTHVYTLKKGNGETLLLNDSLQKVEEMAERIRQTVFPRLYSEYAQSYNAGKAVSFGPVTISKSGGIQVGKKSFPWNEVQQVSIHQGMLSIAKKGGGWFSGAGAAASSIPNLEVLLAIIDQVVGVKAG